MHSGDAGFFDKTGHLKIIDRAKDVGSCSDGSLFPPKYIENKLKFYPEHQGGRGLRERAGLRHRASSTSTSSAVGNWAERNNVVYASYQELANHPLVYDMIAAHVDEVNRSLAAEPMMGGAQIRRFLDPAEGAGRRRRRAHPHPEGAARLHRRALRRAGRRRSTTAPTRPTSATEVTFEDGRKGVIAARVKIRDCKTYPVADAAATLEAAE